MLWFRNVNYCIWQGIPVSYCPREICIFIAVLLAWMVLNALLFKCLDRRCTGWMRLLRGNDRCPHALWSMVRRLFVRLVFS